ncbi:DUF202 domain-containing protein [Arthrobacter sp. STN4]|uniref:DUF202 domain-containing protein n=1 Tax=Arthrobacter sp. STN4 TaxID=2923276 RepID=UPI00211AA2DD|nr:DUF202 domain-containing protein [Arthrobacter sp. STN4]MCQ9163257.1 DUF202 domain-containing protein [Arthrobacter sp. STN4]
MAETTERATRDPGLQPERTALSWRRTIMSIIVADLLIWRGFFHALTHEHSEPGGLFLSALPAHVTGLGVCAGVASLTTVVLVCCAVGRIKSLHAGVDRQDHEGGIAAPALTLRTASAAIVALAVAAIFAIVLGM